MSTKTLSFDEVKAIYTAHHDIFVGARKMLPNVDLAMDINSTLSTEEADRFFESESELYLSMVYAIDDELTGSGWDWAGFLDYQTNNYIESLKQMTEQEVIDLGDVSWQ
jgi:hypothetical protein